MDLKLTDDFTLAKPDIDDKKTLSKEEQVTVETALKKQGRILIHTELKPVKNDYKGDFDRGSVEFTLKCRNYSYHKIVIPDGSVIESRNFTQRKPNTQAIIGKNLTFKECNLVNNVIDPSWTLISCNTSQIDIEEKEEVRDGS
jgi:sensor histidine kinase YesM